MAIIACAQLGSVVRGTYVIPIVEVSEELVEQIVSVATNGAEPCSNRQYKHYLI